MVAGRWLRSRILVGGRDRLGGRPGSLLALSRDASPVFDPVRVHPRLERSPAIDLFPAILLGPIPAPGGRPPVERMVLLQEPSDMELEGAWPRTSGCVGAYDAVCLDHR